MFSLQFGSQTVCHLQTLFGGSWQGTVSLVSLQWSFLFLFPVASLSSPHGLQCISVFFSTSPLPLSVSPCLCFAPRCWLLHPLTSLKGQSQVTGEPPLPHTGTGSCLAPSVAVSLGSSFGRICSFVFSSSLIHLWGLVWRVFPGS